MKRLSYLRTRFATAAILSLGLLLLLAGTASAHAKVLSATPGIGSTITTAPTTITVTTAENMKPDPKLSNLFVYGPSGDLVSQGNATIPLNNPKQMSVKITPEKGDGIYVVRWITVSADDGDPDQGAFVFTVKAAAAVPTAAPTQQTTTAAASTTSTSSGTPTWVPILTGIVALLIGLGAGFGFGRTRPAATPGAGTAGAAVADDKEEQAPRR